jgi:hypothetical protein
VQPFLLVAARRFMVCQSCTERLVQHTGHHLLPLLCVSTECCCSIRVRFNSEVALSCMCGPRLQGVCRVCRVCYWHCNAGTGASVWWIIVRVCCVLGQEPSGGHRVLHEYALPHLAAGALSW